MDHDYEPPVDVELVKAEGVPVFCVIGRTEHDALDPGAFLIEPIGEGLWSVIGLEHDYDVVFADRVLLAARGYEGAALRQAARSNTSERAPIIPNAEELRDFPDMCFESDRLVPSMFADLGTWGAVAAGVGEELYIAPVSDQFALVGLAADGPALDDIKSGAQSDYASALSAANPRNRAVSDGVFRFREGHWRPC